MNKILSSSFLIIALAFSSLSAFAQTVIPCSTHEEYERMIKEDPQFVINQQNLEAFTQQFIAERKLNKTAKASVVIPIVFHIIHNYGSENIPDSRIFDQMEIINKDFQRLNADTNSTNPLFQSIAANPDVEFRLAKIDPSGNCTNGIVRVVSPLTVNANNNVKALSYWPNNKYFNIWVVSSISGAPAGSVILGRSQFPGGSNSTDGILLRSEVCGNTTAFSNFGRTLTHELGHSYNLRHIWGDATCGNDQVGDTPPHNGPNDGCPNNSTSNCFGSVSVDMDENYMDYTNGSCQNMFSVGQDDRMQAVIYGAVNGRNNMWTAANRLLTGTNDGYIAGLCAPKADFALQASVCTNAPVQTNNFSWGGSGSYKWVAPDGTPSIDTNRILNIQFANEGIFPIKLVVTNATGSDSITKFIRVINQTSSVSAPYTENFEIADFEQKGGVIESKDAKRWERTATVGFSNTNSFILRNASGNTSGAIDAFILPNLNLSNVNTGFLKYKRAYAQKSAANTDVLKVLYSFNCGQTFLPKQTRSGAALATAPNSSSSTWAPSGPTQWKKDSIGLSNLLRKSSALIKFEFEAGGGSNIYIDDIEIVITGVVGFSELLVDGTFNIFPNPVNDNAFINFSLIKPEAVNLTVFDLIGREIKVLENTNLSSGDHSYRISKNDLPEGMYLIKLMVGNESQVKKIVFTE